MDGDAGNGERDVGPVACLSPACEGEPTLRDALQSVALPGATVLAVRRWLRPQAPEDVLLQRLGCAGVPVDANSPQNSAPS